MAVRRSGAPRQDLSPVAVPSPSRDQAKGTPGAAPGRDRGVSDWLEGRLLDSLLRSVTNCRWQAERTQQPGSNTPETPRLTPGRMNASETVGKL